MRSRRTPLALVVAVAAGVGIAVASPALAGRDTIRDTAYSRIKIVVSPAKRLQNGQVVKVAWRGLPPRRAVTFRQCTAHPREVQRDCTAIYPDVGSTASNGAGVMYEPVAEGAILSQSHHHFNCDHDTPCSLGVFTGTRLRSGARVPLEFASTPAACPPTTGAGITGGGSDAAGGAMYAWELALCRPPHLTSLAYTPSNSRDGRTNFVNGLSDFAVTGTPFSAAERVELRHQRRTFAYAPVAASGLVLAYKIFDQGPAPGQPGPQVRNLSLTPSLVAQIFTGQITNWQANPQIGRLNPHDTFPPAVSPLVRADHSDANLLFTSWLTATAGPGLPHGWPAPSSNYPLKYLPPGAAIVGGNSLARAVADPTSVGNSNDYSAVGYIGFMDSSLARFYGLPSARIENPAGTFVGATPAAITAALTHAIRNPDGVTVRANFKTHDPNAYPMPVVDYVTVATDHENSATRATLRVFLQYAATAGQASLPPGYTPLPPGMAAQTMRVIAAIPAVPAAPAVPPPSPPPGGGPTSSHPGANHPSGSTGATGQTGPTGPTTETTPTMSPVAAVFRANDGRLVLPVLSGMSALGVLAGMVLLSLGDGRLADGRRRATAAVAGFFRDVPRPRWPGT